MAFQWPEGQRAAVCLTYDDALPVHCDRVAPAMEDAGLRGTFYTPIESLFETEVERWAALAARGHELGNHTVFHPCRATGASPRNWVDPGLNLVDYTAVRFEREIALANRFLRHLDGRAERTYGNTCHDVEIGPADAPQSILPLLADHVVAGRGAYRGDAPIDPASADLLNLGTNHGDRRTADEMKRVIETVVEAGGWMIFCIHGVGEGTHGGYMATDEHTALLRWLDAERANIWAAPLVDVARWVASSR